MESHRKDGLREHTLGERVVIPTKGSSHLEQSPLSTSSSLQQPPQAEEAGEEYLLFR